MKLVNNDVIVKDDCHWLCQWLFYAIINITEQNGICNIWDISLEKNIWLEHKTLFFGEYSKNKSPYWIGIQYS